ncbi:MAG: lipopolysaccharide biosynthesis protein [Bacteroidales bacterium]
MGRIKEFTIETFFYGFANVFSRFFAMLLIPIFTGFLGKIDYANFVMLQSVFTFLTFLLALNAGVFYYYYEYENRKYGKIVFTSWFYYQVFVAIGILILLFFFSPFINKIFIVNEANVVALRWCVALLGVQLFPYIFNITNINLFRIDRKPKKVVGIVFFESLFTLAFVYISLKFLNGGLVGVVLAQIIARSLIALLYLKTSIFYLNINYFSKKILKKIIAFAWPFIIISTLGVIIVNIDKFIGASALSNKEDVAILALAMQLVIPISVLADMIRMALGPYIMSVRRESDAEETYQKVFELSVFAGLVVMVGLVMVSPFLTLILADESFMKVIYLIPMLAMAKVISLASTQFSVSFNLAKKNVFILYSSLIGSAITVLVNYFFLNKYGYLVSGVSQIISYLLMSIFLYSLGRRIANLKIKLKNTLLLGSIVLAYFVSLIFVAPLVLQGEYILFLTTGTIAVILIGLYYLHQQNLSLKIVLNMLLGRFRR